MPEPSSHSPEKDEALPLPPATFEFFVLSLKMQAEMALGLIRLPDQPTQGPDLRVARHTIDLLSMIAEKTRGNLDLDEQRLIENSLTELRFRFVQVSQELSRKGAAVETNDQATESANQ
jgi:hypothetical protein